jgi:hypothetical protein
MDLNNAADRNRPGGHRHCPAVRARMELSKLIVYAYKRDGVFSVIDAPRTRAVKRPRGQAVRSRAIGGA